MSGIVREDSSGRPLAGVEVLVEGTKLKTVSDNGGRYVLGDLPAGDRVALFRFVGYRGVRQRLKLSKGDTTRVDAVMVPDRVRELETVEVTGTPAKPRGGGLESFEERRRLGLGKFIDSTELRHCAWRTCCDVRASLSRGSRTRGCRPYTHALSWSRSIVTRMARMARRARCRSYSTAPPYIAPTEAAATWWT